MPIAVVLALLLSLVGAPFSHVHSEDLDHRSVSGSIHQHDRGHHHDHDDVSSPAHTDAELAARTSDDDFVDVPWAINSPEAVSLFRLAGEISDALRIPLPLVSSRLISETRFHVDDGPDVFPRQNRAPPAV